MKAGIFQKNILPFLLILFSGCGSDLTVPVVDGGSQPDPTQPLRVIETSLPPGRVGESYSFQLNATGGVLPYNWALTRAPGWMRIDPRSGRLYGQPDAYQLQWGVEILLSDGRADVAGTRVLFSIDVAECTDGTRESCSIPGEDICLSGTSTCVNGAMSACEPAGPSTDIQACGPQCIPCDTVRADNCADGTCRCGEGPACESHQQCYPGGICARETSMSWEVDPSLGPEVPSLPTIDGVFERPLAVVVPEEGDPMTLVADEIIIQTREREALANFLARTAGEILAELDPAGSGVPPTFLVRLTPPPADHDALSADIRALAASNGYEAAWGHFRVSSEQALGTMAIAAAEARVASPGFAVGLNFLPRAEAIPGSSQEARRYSGGWHDAYTFPNFDWEGGMQTGVTQAWDLLHLTGRIENRVKLAILDMGFAPDADFASTTGVSVVPFFGPFDQENLLGCSGGNDCPWHGTNVASAAMAKVDNRFGSAGVAGPVAEPIMVFTTYDFFMSIAALLAAWGEDAKVANMSYSAPVHWTLSWSVLPFEATTALLSESMVLFASAGNDGKNVDSENACFIACWEDTWHTPCENNGVTCVGGLGQHRYRDSSSNYGHEHVDLYAPFAVKVGPDPQVLGPGDADAIIQTKYGTSFASPFAAGVAALVLAANPDLTARQVPRLLRDHADVESSYCCGDIYRVDARTAVLDAIGLGLAVEIDWPQPGEIIEWNTVPTFLAPITLVGPHGEPVDVEIVWESSVDGFLASEILSCTRPSSHGVHATCTSRVSLSLGLGEHVISVRAAAGSEESTASVPVLVRNSPPSGVQVMQPADGASICHGQQVLLRGIASDPNETLGPESFSWHSDLDGDLGTGTLLMAEGLRCGGHVITLVATDEQGLTSSHAIGLTVLSASHPDCLDLSPAARVTSPANGAFFTWEGWDGSRLFADVTLAARVEDAEDPVADLLVEWWSDRDGLLGTGENLTVRLYMDFCGETDHVITLEVRDTAGNLTTDQIVITLQAPPC